MTSERRAKPAPGSPDYAALQAAAEWFAVLRADDASAADRCAWQAWLNAGPTHHAAWRRIEAVNQRFGMLQGEAARETLSTGPWQRRSAVRTLALLAGALAGGALLLGRDDSRAYLAGLGADYRTDIGATRRVLLAEGSQLWLNTGSAVDVDYSATLRRVHLRSGELLLESARDGRQPARPLVVDAPHGRLTALGTRFRVLATAHGTELAVYDGAVRVQPRAGSAPRTVPAGQQVRFGDDWMGAPSAADERQAAWSENRLVADQMRLDDFLAELARYRHGHLGCAPAVAHLRLTGSYPLTDTDRILTALAATLPVQVRRVLPWWVTLDAVARHGGAPLGPDIDH